MVIQKIPLHAGQFYSAKTKKAKICLHHTAGPSAASAISWWNQTPERVATPYVIERDGTIFECFDPNFWAYSLGVKGATVLEHETVAIELVSWGWLKEVNGLFYSSTGKKVSIDELITFKEPYRGFKHYQNYTAEQIIALKELLLHLNRLFKIPLKPNDEHFYEFRDWKTIRPGIYSHTTVRKDKQDIIPQQNLINMLMGLPV